MARKTISAFKGFDQEALLEELDRLREALHEYALAGKRANPGVMLAVFKLCGGLQTEEWDALAGKFGLEEWLTLPLDAELYPALSALQQKLSRLAHLTDHDPLTGLANRRALERTLQLEMERAVRFKSPLSLALFDLDDFKNVNDTYGHACGDAVLSGFARSLSGQIRKTDIAARYGGEEFALILPGTGQARSEHMLTRIQQSVTTMRTSCPGQDQPVRVTCSIGVATYRGRASITWHQLVQHADDALYQAKNQGKNQVVLAPLIDLDMPREQTQVLHEEKQFLFSKDE